MALVSYSDLLTRSTGGSSGAPEDFHLFIDKRVANGASAAADTRRTMSLWTQSSSYSSGGVAPGAVSVPTNATEGSLKQTDPAGGLTKYLTCFGATFIGWTAAANTGTLMLYDRLLHISGLSGTNTGTQTVGGTLTRNTGGVGNQIWVEIYNGVGSTPTTIQASYTNQAGTAGQTTVATTFGGTHFQLAQSIIALPLAAGDYGVQAVASVKIAGSTLTAGNFGVTVARPLAILPVTTSGLYSYRNYTTGFPNSVAIDTGACLAFMWSGASGVNQHSMWIDLMTVCA